MIKAIIFDMNGVIIDDEDIHEMAFRKTLKPYGIDLDHQTYTNYCIGITTNDGFKQIQKKFNINLPINNLTEQENKFYLKLFPKNKKTYPNVIELINFLEKDFILALTSGAPRNQINLIIKEFGIDKKFKVTISANDITKGKPDPEPYLITIKKIGLKPEECLVIEDSPMGIKSAKTAGCFCIGITTTHPKDKLKQADLIVDSFSQITSQIIQNLPNL